MNEIINNIKSRRSIRAFITDKNISDDDLKIITEAAIYAPSGMNRQTWQFTVIRDRSVIKKLCSVIGDTLGRDAYDMYNPNVIIITSNDKSNSNGNLDCACALQNIFLAANSLGIGSVWINQLKDICDDPLIRAELDSIGIPACHNVYGIAALGYSDNYSKNVEKNPDVIKWIG